MKIPAEQMAAQARLVALAVSKASDQLQDDGHDADGKSLRYAIDHMSVRQLAYLYHFMAVV